MGTDRSPAQLIAESDGLLLDFDGPVCDVYARSDPAKIAAEVRAAFNLEIETDDPLDLISHALANGGPVDDIHQMLTEAEIEAVRTATETPGIRHLIESYSKPIAIVSNNATSAIETWLNESGLHSMVAAVTGRDPRRMKPDPWGMVEAAKSIGQNLARCVFIGDSMSDLRAAELAGTPFIALANKPGKRRKFEAEGCNTIADDMATVLSARHPT